MAKSELQIAKENYGKSLSTLMCFVAEHMPEQYDEYVELMKINDANHDIWRTKYFEK